MSEGNRFGVPTEVLHEMRSILTKAFVPCASIDPVDDTMTIIERDCSMCEETVPGSAITLLRDNHNGEVVGVKISGWSKWSKDF